MSQAVQDLLQRIQDLPEEDRLVLEEELAQLAETKAGHDENGQVRYPLRGNVIRYDNPTDPIAENDWEALR